MRRNAYTLYELLVAMVIMMAVTASGLALLHRTMIFHRESAKATQYRGEAQLLRKEWRRFWANSGGVVSRAEAGLVADDKVAKVEGQWLVLADGADERRLRLPFGLDVELMLDNAPSLPRAVVLRLRWRGKHGWRRKQGRWLDIVACPNAGEAK